MNIVVPVLIGLGLFIGYFGLPPKFGDEHAKSVAASRLEGCQRMFPQVMFTVPLIDEEYP